MFNDAYQRNCKYCGELILMAEDDRGIWQPWDLDGQGRHTCSSTVTVANSASSSKNNSQTELLKYKINVAVQQNAITYPTQCWWCGADVFYHSNGYGDCVLFDSLGYPWEIHDCWERYWNTEQEIRHIIQKLWKNRHSDLVNLFPKSFIELGVHACVSFVIENLEAYRERLKIHDGWAQKCLILAGVIRMVNRNGLPITEENVAKYMGFSLENFRNFYPSPYLYTLYLKDGVRLMRLEDPQVWLRHPL
jgi:hypothetical protein